jgi:hypothetical protein
MNFTIPTWAQSSVDPNQVSLTITSIGKAGTALIVFLGMVGVVDPTIAGQAWGSFVASVITAVPAGFAVYHSGQVLWGVFRKVAVALFAKPIPPAV